MFTTLCTKFISKNTFTKTFNSISILQQKQQTSQFSIKNATKNFSSRTIQFSSTTNWTLPVTGHLPTALAYSPVNHSLLDSPNKKNFLKDTNSELMLKANNQKSRSSTKKFSSNFTKLIAVGVNSQKRAFSTRIPKINEDQKVEQASFFQSFLQRGDHQWMMALLIGINVGMLNKFRLRFLFFSLTLKRKKNFFIKVVCYFFFIFHFQTDILISI